MNPLCSRLFVGDVLIMGSDGWVFAKRRSALMAKFTLTVFGDAPPIHGTDITLNNEQGTISIIHDL